MDPVLRTLPGFPKLEAPKASRPQASRPRFPRRPGRPLLALFVASKSWASASKHKAFASRPSRPSPLRSHKVNIVEEKKLFENDVMSVMSSVLNDLSGDLHRALSELSDSKKLLSLKSAVKEAHDFAELADDGVKPHLWEDADVILVGPSRTGKTTLAKYLAKLGLRAANYPLVHGEDIPQDLFRKRSKLALLTTEADALQSIRRDRMKRLGMSSSSYAGISNIRKELDWVKMLYTRNFTGFPVVNTAKCTIAEAASMVLSHMYGGHVDSDTTTRLVNLISMLTHGSAT